MAVAFDLAFDEKGEVILGPETKIACDLAMKLAQKDRAGSRIIVTAGKAPGKWKNEWMASLMNQYIHSRDKELKTIAHCAETFNTYGEMKTLADIISVAPRNVTEVILSVKWWHAPRAKYLCRHHLKWQGFGNLPVTVEICDSNASLWLILKEYTLSWPKNILRVWFKL